MSEIRIAGPGPTLEEALEEIRRVGVLVGGAFAVKWARTLKLVAAKLAEGSPYGPGGARWRLFAGSMKLQADIAEYGYERRRGRLGAKALAARLPGLEAEALDAEDQLEVAALRLELEALVGAEVEQERLKPQGHHGKSMIEGKAFFFNGAPARAGDFERLVRSIGGYREPGAEPGTGGLDEIHFCRGMQLIEGRAEPEGDAELRALKRWHEKWPK